jgi:ectoine hydroxylase-related dioxygenase (phytanoyl-CoA dioxygenase family)
MLSSSKYTFLPQDQGAIQASIEELGFAVVQDIFSSEEMALAADHLLRSVEKEAQFHGAKEHKDYGILLACPIYGGPFLKVLDNKDLWAPFNQILGNSCIAYVYTSSSLPPGDSNFTSRIHVDRPHFKPNAIEDLGCLICVSAFNKKSGGTWVLPKSHETPDQPERAYFYENAIQIKAEVGSVFYFNLRLWHAGGQNLTSHWRHALGLGMIKPYLKQRIDLPRAIPKEYQKDMSVMAKQKLGYFAQAPTSLEEFYAPIEKRTYSEKSEWDK